MKDKIQRIKKLREEIAAAATEAQQSGSIYIGAALSALNAAADNLQWHDEAVASAPAPKLASAEAPKK